MGPNSKTTIAGILTALAALFYMIAHLLNGAIPSADEIAGTIAAFSAAYGLWKAADARKEPAAEPAKPDGPATPLPALPTLPKMLLLMALLPAFLLLAGCATRKNVNTVKVTATDGVVTEFSNTSVERFTFGSGATKDKQMNQASYLDPKTGAKITSNLRGQADETRAGDMQQATWIGQMLLGIANGPTAQTLSGGAAASLQYRAQAAAPQTSSPLDTLVNTAIQTAVPDIVHQVIEGLKPKP